MCRVKAGFFPAKDSDQDRNYCKILEQAFKKKHGLKACDLTIRLIYPVFEALTVGTVQFWDESDTLKTLKEIVDDPEMTVTFRVSDKWIAGQKPFAGTEGMMLDTNATFICENQIDLTPLESEFDVVFSGSDALYVTVLLDFNPQNLQQFMTELKEKPSGESLALKPGKKAAKSKKSNEKPKNSDVNLKNTTEKVEAQTVLTAAVETESQEIKLVNPESASITTDLVVKSENLENKSGHLRTDSENHEIKSGVPVVVPTELSCRTVVPFELSICKKIFHDQIACDIIIVAKDDKAVHCHKSFLLAHSTTFANYIKKNEIDGLQNVLEMKDISEEGVKALLAYLYYWDQTEPNNKSLIAFELLLSGHNYDMPLLQTTMKTILLSKPNSWYDPEVAVKLFQFARNLTSNEDELKMKAIKVIKENLSQVEQCQAYKELFMEHPDVAMELCRFAFSS